MQRPRLAGAQGRLQVQRALLRLRAGRPGVLHRGRCGRRAPAADADRARHRRGRGAPSRDFAARKPDVTVTRAALRQRRSARTCATSWQPAARAAGGARRSSASTRACSSSTRTTSSAASSTRSRHDLDGVFNCAADGVLALTEVADLLGKPFAPLLPPCGTGLAAGVASASAIRLPPEMLRQLRFGRGLDNRRLKATGYRYRYTTRETIQRLREHQRVEPILRGAPARALPLRARGRGVPALQPERAARRPPRRPPSRATPRPAAPRSTTTSTPASSSRCCPRSTPTACVPSTSTRPRTRPARPSSRRSSGCSPGNLAR